MCDMSSSVSYAIAPTRAPADGGAPMARGVSLIAALVARSTSSVDMPGF